MINFDLQTSERINDSTVNGKRQAVNGKRQAVNGKPKAIYGANRVRFQACFSF